MLISHNSPIDDEYQTQAAKVLALPQEHADHNDSNDTPKIMSDF